MKYKVIKKNIGKKNVSIFSTFETEKEIIDTTFHDKIGLMFIEKDNPSITLINLKGKVIENWMGKKEKSGCQNGSHDISTFTNPCSICHNGTMAYVLEDNGYLIRQFSLEYRYVESLTGKSYKADLHKQIFSQKAPIIKSSAGKNTLFFTNNMSNKCFYVKHGKLDHVIGDGKARFCISSDYKRSSLNRPSGIFAVGDNVYVSDTKSHCIRQIDKLNKSIKVAFGSPLETNDLKNTLMYPSKLVIKKNMVFMLDGNRVKVSGLNGGSISSVYESDNIESIEADSHRNLYVMERDDA